MDPARRSRHSCGATSSTPSSPTSTWKTTRGAEFTTRAAPYCLRIAGLYAVLDGRDMMSKDDLAAAAALVRYSLAPPGTSSTACTVTRG